MALLGLLAVLTTYFTCSNTFSSEDGAIYAAAISAALDRNDVLPDATVYVIPSVERRTDTHRVEELALSRETQDEILKNLGRVVRFADPDSGSAVRVALGAVEERGDQRTVRVQLLDGIDGLVATYVLERRGNRWSVVSAMNDGVMQPS